MADTECLRLHDRHTLRMRDTAFARCVVCCLTRQCCRFMGISTKLVGKSAICGMKISSVGIFQCYFLYFYRNFVIWFEQYAIKHHSFKTFFVGNLKILWEFQKNSPLWEFCGKNITITGEVLDAYRLDERVLTDTMSHSEGKREREREIMCDLMGVEVFNYKFAYIGLNSVLE